VTAGPVEETRPTIAVADDEPALRLLCRVNLEAEGYCVIEAGSADELERVLASREVAVVLLDIGLGRDDGVEVARRLRAERPETALAFFTGSERAIDDAVRGLADAVLAKPFTLELLSQTVRRLARPP
jgi:DNA-binding response OmpR family regulator